MNSEIEFRAFDPVLGMRPVDEMDGQGLWWKVSTATGIYTLNQIPPMQYIGRKDKNDVEIFNRDIIRLKKEVAFRFPQAGHYMITTEVYSENGSFRFKGLGCVDCNWDQYDDIEVIGNIYEHSHLMTEGNAVTEGVQ